MLEKIFKKCLRNVDIMDSISINNSKKMKTREQLDLEANAFAVALLVPEKLCDSIIEKYDLDMSDDSLELIILSEKIGVSYGLLMFRLGQVWERKNCRKG
jgi:Zn-dependent peptidase ImmA (M78 family)